MVNAQWYLLNNYTDKTVKEINIHSKDLEGGLDLSEFINLEKLDCSKNKIDNLKLPNSINYLRSSNNKLTNLDVSGCTQLKELRCDSNQLVSLDVLSNKDLSQLVCSHNKIKVIDVRDNIKLINLNVSHNKITALDVSKSLNLENLNVYDNKIALLDTKNLENLVAIDFSNNPISFIDCTRLKFLETIDCSSSLISNIDFLLALPDPKRLLNINISNNSNLPSESYSSWGYFGCYNLQGLDLSGNEFFGSLENLRYLRKLEFLNISDTNISNGLEYLPESLSSSGFLFSSIKDGLRVKKIEEELSSFGGDLGKWREQNQTFLQRIEREKEQIKEKYDLLEKSFNSLKNKSSTSEVETQTETPTGGWETEKQQLQAKIAELEAKLRQQPNAPTNEEDKKEIKRLQDELDQLRKKNNPQQSSKDNFPYGLVIGGGGDNTPFINYYSGPVVQKSASC